MIIMWNDAKSFKRHIEAMRTFRQSHSDYPVNGLFLKDFPIPYDIPLSQREKLITYLKDTRGKLIIVPIWKMTVPLGSQN